MSTKNNVVPFLLLLCGVALAIFGVYLYRKNQKNPETEKAEKSESKEKKTPEGIVISNVKNNNPGNIRINKALSWKGRVPLTENTDGKFEQFKEKFWGVRAMTRIVKGWIEKNKATTLTAIINKYAPPVENKTNEYIQFVAKETGIDPNMNLSPDKKTLKSIIMAMGTMETGKGSITSAEFEKAWQNLS